MGRNDLGSTRIYPVCFQRQRSDPIDDLFGGDKYDAQLEYLCDKSIMTIMKSVVRIDRIEVINATIPSLAKDGQEMTERKLVRKVVIRNIPESSKQAFTLQEGDKLKTLKDEKKALMKIEQAYGSEPRTSRKKTRNK